MHGTTAERLAVAVLVVLAAATAYEALVALGVVGLGDEPGQGPPGESIATTAAVLALLLGAGASVANAGRPRFAFLAPAAAAFLVARFYAYDPYYAPSMRRASEGGVVTAWWVFALVTAAVGSAGMTLIRPRPGQILTCAVVILCVITALAVRLGH